MFRKTFRVESRPLTARIHITASDKYRLFVNGKYVGRGPARNAGPFWTSYDTHDVTQLIREDNNTIAVHGYYYGCPTVWSADMPPGLWVEAEMLDSDGTSAVVVSDDTWKVETLTSYAQETQRINGWQGPIEVYRVPIAGRSEFDLAQTGFDDAAWKTAAVIARPQLACWGCVAGSTRPMPWSYLEPRDVPLLLEREVLPTKIVRRAEAASSGSHDPEDKGVCQQMAREPLSDLQQAAVENAESLLKGTGEPALFRSNENRLPVLIIDFGRPLFGCVRLDIESPADAVIDVGYGNVVMDGRVEVDKASLFGDRCICRSGRQAWETFDARQFRYLQLVIRNTRSEPVRLHRVSAISQEYPIRERRRFECSDKTFEDVWRAAGNTIFLHLEDTIVCDATRERAQYPVAMTLETALYALYRIYGDTVMADKIYKATGRMQLASGHLPAYGGSAGTTAIGLPKSRVPYGKINTLSYPSSCFGYVLGAHTHYMESGDVEFVKRLYPSLLKLVQYYEQHADERGLLQNMPNMNWMDWTAHDLGGIVFWYNACWARTLEVMTELGEAVGIDYNEDKWMGAARSIKQFLRDNHWNPQEGLFTDSLAGSQQSAVFSELTNAGALLFGVADRSQAEAIVRGLGEQRSRVVKASPLTFFYVTEGLVAAGATDLAWSYLSRRFRPIVSGTDFPTLPEGWPEQETTGASKSHIHSSGCGLAFTLSRHMLGVYPAKPGFEECRIAPKPGHLTWAKGSCPSPRGDIQVDWHVSDGTFTMNVDIPANMKTFVCVPAPFSGPQYGCTVDGNPVALKEEIHVPAGQHRVRCMPPQPQE